MPPPWAVTPGDPVREEQLTSNTSPACNDSLPFWAYYHGYQARAMLVGSAVDPSQSQIVTLAKQHLNRAVPSIGDEVLARVTRVSSRGAALEIVALNNVALPSAFSGLIRMNDTVSLQPEKVALHECYRPGDGVRARVVSIGDARYFYCSTAEPELGVIFATHRSTHEHMYAKSWTEMACKRTHMVENRKVAGPKQV